MPFPSSYSAATIPPAGRTSGRRGQERRASATTRERADPWRKGAAAAIQGRISVSSVREESLFNVNEAL